MTSARPCRQDSIGGFYTNSDVGIVRINSVDLQKTLLPSPIAKLEEVSKMLPDLAASMYQVGLYTRCLCSASLQLNFSLTLTLMSA